MKLIPLTQGKFAKVDDSDFEILSAYTWRYYPDKHTGYACRKDSKSKTGVIMHRQILGLTDPSIFVDHKDRDGLNNQRANLRIATVSDNSANRKKRINSTSKYIGVWKQGNYWCGSLRKHGKLKFRKFYPLTSEGEIQAAKAYDEQAKIHHGEFANLNFK